MTSLLGDGAAYFWLINASALAEFITWAGIAWSHYKFRKAYIAQGKDINDLSFKAKWYLLGPILALIMCIIVIIGQNYEALIQGRDFVVLLLLAILDCGYFCLFGLGINL